MSQLSSYALLTLVGIAGAAGDAMLSQWAATRGSHWLLVSYVIWIATATLFGFVLRSGAFTFSVAVVLALLMHCVVAVIIDRGFFGTPVNSWHWLGIALACTAMICIEIGRAVPSTSLSDDAGTP